MPSRAATGPVIVLACAVCLGLLLPSVGRAAGSPARRAGNGSSAGYTAPGSGSAPTQPATGDQSGQTRDPTTRGGDVQPASGSSDGGESTQTAKMLPFLLVLFIVMIAVPVQIAKGVATRRQARAEATSAAAVRPADPRDAA